MTESVGTFDNDKKVKAKAVAGYVLLPRILPRFKDLMGSGFGYLAFLIASIFHSVRILPTNHPYTSPSNVGKFSIRQVVAAAAHNIEFSKKNVDQIIIFLAIITGIILMIMQFIGILFMMVVGSAQAGGAINQSMFVTPSPQTDIAFLLLDHVFGIPNFYGSNINATLPTAFHTGIHALFRFYNTALLIVAALIFLYYVLVVVVETAASGTPFGKRFAHIYAPLRLVAAVGLLVPLNYGLNTSQYITLWAAKMGSGLATNTWITFNNTLTNPYGTSDQSLLARPRTPEVDKLASFMTVVHACRASYCLGKTPQPASQNTLTCGNSPGLDIRPYVALGHTSTPIDITGTAYTTARDYYNPNDTSGSPIKIVFGHQDSGQHSQFDANVNPYCGVLHIPINFRDTAQQAQDDGLRAEAIQEAYYNIIRLMWQDNKLQALGERFAFVRLNTSNPTRSCHRCGDLGDCGTCADISYEPDSSGIKLAILTDHQSTLNAAVQTFYQNARNSLNANVPPEVLDRGWAGAGMTTYTIADLNGRFFEAVMNQPDVVKWPEIMERIRKQKAVQDGQTTSTNQFTPGLAENTPLQNMANNEMLTIGKVLNNAYLYWEEDQTTNERPLSDNIFLDTMNALFGTYGLFCMIDPFPNGAGAQPDSWRSDCNDETHPLAQLVALGKGLVTSAIENLGRSMAFATVGGAANILSPHFGSALDAVSGFYMSIATIGLGVGFTLYYVVPFLPFIYFFFAVGGWVKAVFEAMIGAPLWALAHLRIDGDGFSGNAASAGYLLIFEIFLRPVLTIFGMVGGLVIFTALAHILHEIFTLVIVNISGYEPRQANPDTPIVENLRRNIVDEFFFTVIYTMIIYMMATASFKMIDMVPNFIIRWMGQNVSSFGDQREDPTKDMVQYAAIGGHVVGGQVAGAMQSAARGVGQTGAGAVEMAQKLGKAGD